MKGFPFAGKSPIKQDEMMEAAAAGAITGAAAGGGGGGKHPLYKQLTTDEKATYDALTPEEKVNVDKNATISQLKNALGKGPKWEGGDDDPN
tara:strand:- start:161 stop:436 length:276 start_codon:yes stop_codon:yes gene_type:complete